MVFSICRRGIAEANETETPPPTATATATATSAPPLDRNNLLGYRIEPGTLGGRTFLGWFAHQLKQTRKPPSLAPAKVDDIKQALQLLGINDMADPENFSIVSSALLYGGQEKLSAVTTLIEQGHINPGAEDPEDRYAADFNRPAPSLLGNLVESYAFGRPDLTMFNEGNKEDGLPSDEQRFHAVRAADPFAGNCSDDRSPAQLAMTDDIRDVFINTFSQSTIPGVPQRLQALVDEPHSCAFPIHERIALSIAAYREAYSEEAGNTPTPLTLGWLDRTLDGVHRFQTFCASRDDDEKTRIAEAAFQERDMLHSGFAREFGQHAIMGPPSFIALLSRFAIMNMCVHHLLTQSDATMDKKSANVLLNQLLGMKEIFRGNIWDPQVAAGNRAYITENPYNKEQQHFLRDIALRSITLVANLTKPVAAARIGLDLETARNARNTYNYYNPTTSVKDPTHMALLSKHAQSEIMRTGS